MKPIASLGIVVALALTSMARGQGAAQSAASAPTPPLIYNAEIVGRASEAEYRVRYDRMWALVAESNYDEALPELIWLWKATDNKATVGEPAIRAEIIEGIGRIAAHHEPTRTYFSKVLDDLGAYIREDRQRSFSEWSDWADLSRAMGQEDRLIRLYDERKTPEGGLPMFVLYNTDPKRAQSKG